MSGAGVATIHDGSSPPLLSFECALEAHLGDLPQPLSLLTACATQGDELVGVRFGSASFAYVVTDPALVADVLIERRDLFRRDDEFIRTFSPLLGSGLITDEHPDWSHRRRRVQAALHASHARLAAVAGELAAELVTGWPCGDVRELVAELGALHWEILARTLLGDSGAALADPRRRQGRQDVPWGPGWAELSAQLELWPTDGAEVVALLDAPASEPDTSIAGRDQLITLLFGGRDTTASGLTWTFIALAANPGIQARVRDELRGLPTGGALTVSSVKGLPYLRAVIAESLRLYPPTAFITRAATETVRLGDFTVPAGATIVLSPWLTHRDPRNFPDPLAFRPERWASASATPQAGYFPFGAGPRMCVARATALTEIALVVAEVFARRRLMLVGRPPAPALSPTLVPSERVPVRLDRVSG